MKRRPGRTSGEAGTGSRFAFGTVLALAAVLLQGGVLAQVFLGPARLELDRVTAGLNTASASGSSKALYRAVVDAAKTIDNVASLPTDALDRKLDTTRKLYAREAVKVSGRLAASCLNRGFRADGDAARKVLGDAVKFAGSFVTKKDYAEIQAQVKRCLKETEVREYQGTVSSTARTATSLEVMTGDITWKLTQSVENGGSFLRTYSGSGTLSVNASEGQCRGQGRFPVTDAVMTVQFTPVGSAGGSGFVAGNVYLFGLASRGVLTLTCPKGESRSVAVPPLASDDASSYRDVLLLEGKAGGKAPTAWSFMAVK